MIAMKKTIRAPTRLIEDMKRFAYRAAENKFTPADIFNMACAYSQRIVVNDFSIVDVDNIRVSSDDLFAYLAPYSFMYTLASSHMV